MTTAFADAISLFKHRVPGCPEFEAIQALRFAVIEFCKETSVLQAWVTKSSNALTFDTSTGEAPTQVVGLFDAFVDGVQAGIVHLNSAQIDEADETAPVITHNDDLNTTLAITPVPATVVDVRLLVSFAPTPDANEFDTHLWTMHREALRWGALARLLREPGTRYVDPNLAGTYRADFEAAMSKASTASSVNRATTGRVLRVTPS